MRSAGLMTRRVLRDACECMRVINAQCWFDDTPCASPCARQVFDGARRDWLLLCCMWAERAGGTDDVAEACAPTKRRVVDRHSGGGGAGGDADAPTGDARGAVVLADAPPAADVRPRLALLRAVLSDDRVSVFGDTTRPRVLATVFGNMVAMFLATSTLRPDDVDVDDDLSSSCSEEGGSDSDSDY